MSRETLFLQHTFDSSTSVQNSSLQIGTLPANARVLSAHLTCASQTNTDPNLIQTYFTVGSSTAPESFISAMEVSFSIGMADSTCSVHSQKLGHEKSSSSTEVHLHFCQEVAGYFNGNTYNVWIEYIQE